MLDPSDVRLTPWANGRGSTREVAIETDADGRTRWRVSVATLLEDADFSVLPGLDRLFVPCGPVRLTIDGEARNLASGDQARFAGEQAVAVALAAPTVALNVMTRRGHCRAEVTWSAAGSAAAAGVSVRLPGGVAEVQIIDESGA